MKKTIVYIISQVGEVPAFIWLAERSKRENWNLVFVLLNETPGELHRMLRERGIESFWIPYRGKRDTFSSFIAVYKLLRTIRPDIVHTHLSIANLIGLPAALFARVPRRIYTRHHSNGNAVGPARARLYDWCANRLATQIIATCKNVETYLVSKERVRPKKIKTINLGFEIAEFRSVSEERILRVKDKYDYGNKGPVVGLISRYVSLKGVEYAIDAFRGLLTIYPNACLVLANAVGGNAKESIKNKLSLLPADSFREIIFESDARALMGSFDVFVHVPIDKVSEAFGQVYIEALLSKTPSVATSSGIGPEILRHRENSILVPFADSESILSGMQEILNNPTFAEKLTERGFCDASGRFPMSRMVNELRELYG